MSKEESIGRAIAGLIYVAVNVGAEVYKAYQRDKRIRPNLHQREEVKGDEGAQQDEAPFQLDPEDDIESLTCPITMDNIQEPATTVYGHLFELSAIREWVSLRGTCPLTKQPLR